MFVKNRKLVNSHRNLGHAIEHNHCASEEQGADEYVSIIYGTLMHLSSKEDSHGDQCYHSKLKRKQE